MKLLKFVLFMLVFPFAMCICTSAADAVVYVNANSTNDAENGTAHAPFKTLEAAVAFFEGSSGGKIVVCSSIDFADATELSCKCDGSITVTADAEGQINFAGKFYINAPLIFENIKLNFTTDTPMIFCEGNNVTFGEGVTTSYISTAPIIHGGTYGGKSGMTQKKMCFSDYTISVKSGTWYYVKGGSYRDAEGQPVGTLSNVTVDISGGTFISNRTGASDNAVISPLGFDALLGDATLNISGGSFACSIVGVARPGYNSTTSNNQYVKGNICINISGGTFTGGDVRAVQDSVASEIDGDFFVNISGGSFKNFGEVDGECVNGLAIADVKSGISAKNVKPLVTVSSGGTAVVTDGGVIRVKGAINSSALKISGDKKVIIEGASADASITIDNVLYVGTNTEIRNVALNGYGTGIISCSDGKILIDEGITGNGIALKNFTDATVRSGLFAYIKGAREKSVKLHIDGATVTGDVVAVANKCNENGYVLLTSGTVGGNVYAFEYSGNEGAVHILTDDFCGKVGVAKYPTDKCVNVFGAVAPATATVDYKGCVNRNASLDAVFVRSGGEGDGSSALSPMGDLAAAVDSANGKTVVVCGPLYLKATTSLPAVSGKTVITSKYMGLDYRDFTDAHIELSAGLYIGGKTVFENVDFLAFEKYTFLSAEGHDLTIGEGVECRIFEGKRVEKYPSLVGASHEKTVSINSVNLTVLSGTWGTLAGGSYHTSDTDTKNYTVTGDVNMNIYGGTFVDGVYLAGRANVGGNATFNIYGGCFECPVYAAHDNDTTVNGDVKINIQGGTFCGDIYRYGVGNSFTLNMAGGDFNRVGIVDVGGGTLNVGEGIDLDAEVFGVGQYQNPTAGYADPSVVYHDGWYYYSFAKDYLGKPGLWMAKAANIYDIGNVRPTLIWAQATSEHETVVKSLWAPQLYFLEGKWYLYATCDVGLETTLSNGRRMPVVWRAETDDPYGKYEYLGVIKNVDMDVVSYNSPRIIKHGGKLYMINGSFFREEDCTNQHIQRTFISELSDPITVSGKAFVISSPMYDYEKNIMEGPFPVYSPSGTLYVIFAAGHTRSDEYCTGIMRFNGTEKDSLQDASKWEKFSEPLQFASYENGVYSPGAMVVTTTPDGSEYLAVYHAKEYHYSAYTMRRLYVQKLWFENDFPRVDAPQPTDTVFELALNKMPLSKRVQNYSLRGVAALEEVDLPKGETEYIPCHIYGDVNFDEKVNLLDALNLAKIIAGGSKDPFELARADTNGDGNVNVSDLLKLLKDLLR